MNIFINDKGTVMKLLLSTGSLFILLILTSCLDMNSSFPDVKPTKYFSQNINVENSQKKYYLGDTLWFNAMIPDSLINLNTGETEVLENASFIFSGELYLLKPVYDSLSFIDNNFDIVITDGTFELANVIEYTYTTFMFSIRFGKPAYDNKIRFGVVPKYLGAFSFEATSHVYYGEERSDYDDFSQDHEVGYISLNFNLTDVNEDVYNSLPALYRQHYDNYYTSNSIAAKQFYFIEVTEE
jgi:hypothetical protein